MTHHHTRSSPRADEGDTSARAIFVANVHRQGGNWVATVDGVGDVSATALREVESAVRAMVVGGQQIAPQDFDVDLCFPAELTKQNPADQGPTGTAPQPDDGVTPQELPAGLLNPTDDPAAARLREGSCKHCGADGQWVRTRTDKWVFLEPGSFPASEIPERHRWEIGHGPRAAHMFTVPDSGTCKVCHFDVCPGSQRRSPEQARLHQLWRAHRDRLEARSSIGLARLIDSLALAADESPSGPDQADPVITADPVAARYASRCCACRKPINIGELISRTQLSQWRHTACEEPEPSLAEEPGTYVACERRIDVGELVVQLAQDAQEHTSCHTSAQRRFRPAPRRDPGYQNTCPTCGTVPGDPCLTTTGKKRPVHPARRP